VIPQAEARNVRRVYSMLADDRIYEAFAKYVFLTTKQMQSALGCKFDYINVRLRRLCENGYLGRVQQNDFSEFLYFLTEQGALKAIERGAASRKWYVQKKSPMQLPHEKGITDCQLLLAKHFDGAEFRRWRTDLQKDFDGEVPDLFFDLKDGTGWCPMEYERMNPVSREKLADYAKHFPRTYIVVQTTRRVEMLLASIEDTLNTPRLWFTSVDVFSKNPTGKIWWTPKNFRDRAYSILRPES